MYDEGILQKKSNKFIRASTDPTIYLTRVRFSLSVICEIVHLPDATGIEMR